MTPFEIIRKKRDGSKLSYEELEFFFNGCMKNKIPDYQAAALLMAIFLKGMDARETFNLTKIMHDSGDFFDLSGISGIKVDKHSTGGVGDKISIPLAPLVAACGVKVPMMSGRGLGHTGGTLDKLESIPGFNVNLTHEDFEETVKKLGCAMIGQTKKIAPLDKKLYALRDVTATIASIPLITASIMSKKLAEGMDALVLDVKVGNGAFMKKISSARRLARSMVSVGKKWGKRICAFLTDMDQPMGNAIGNSLEIIESIEVLKGNGPQDVEKLVIALGGQMLYFGRKAKTLRHGESKIMKTIANGQGLAKFRDMIKKQGGNPKVIDNYDLLPKSKNQIVVNAEHDGYIKAIETEEIGRSGILLGGGRLRKEDKIDPSVGFIVHKKISDHVKKDEALVTIHFNDDKNLDEVISKISAAYKYSNKKPVKPKLIKEKIV